MLKSVGIQCDRPKPKIVLTEEEKGAGKKILLSSGIKFDKPIIAIHLMTSNLVKTWGKDKYRGIIERIAKELEADIILVGADSERENIEQISEGVLSPERNLAGKTSLRELVSILHQTDVFLGSDSGPMHIASTGGAYVIAIFNLDGGSSPRRWGPCTDNVTIFTQEFSGADIGVDIVFNAVRGAIAK